MYYTAAAITALVGIASAQKMHVVSVGAKGNTFSPDKITAAVGDMVQFQFQNGNHSVVQSSFDAPCKPINAAATNSSAATTGFYSGYEPIGASDAMIPAFSVNITDTKPIWAYCSQSTHCQGGMSMVINENPTLNASRTLDAYKAAAKGVAKSAAGAEAGAGGTDGTVPSDGTTSGTDSSNPAASGTPPPAAAGNMVTVSSSMGLFALAAALFML